MKHLIVSREFPPAPYAPGGIGAYVVNIARLLVDRGETVHIIAQRWDGAPVPREVLCDGRLIVHRIGEQDIPDFPKERDLDRLHRELNGLKATTFPTQWFAWHTAFLAEQLIEDEGIDVIEGQEWEAPLYYLLLRRSIGMGPERRPPCIVHLHSPTRFIRHFNGALSTPQSYALMKRMEEFCIRSADALLCPSRTFAAQCRREYGLPEDAIEIIHLPVGFAPALERSAETWSNGSICFVGRLEPRKGIIEWMEAATRVAQDDPAVHFDFVGDDVWGLRKPLLGRVPRALRHRFRFHGSKTKAQLPHYLSRAKAAVVPSRWENFPNVCIEAMSSGLPVISTRMGGMVELLEDGRTGWLTPDTGVSGMVDGLAAALRRCLAASPGERAAMGAAAAQAVRSLCDNQATVDAHIAFRGGLARAGARPRVSEVPDASAKIVVRADRLSDAGSVLASIEAQTLAPEAVIVIFREKSDDDAKFQLGGSVAAKHRPDCTGPDAWNAGVVELGEHDGFWLFLDSFDRLAPRCLERVTRAFAQQPDAGIATLWTERMAGEYPLDAPPCPEPASQLIRNDVTPASAFRAAALGTDAPFLPGITREHDIWHLANRVMAGGWAAVAVPEALATRMLASPVRPWPDATALRAIRAELLAPLKKTGVQTALDLVDDYVPLPGAGPEPEAFTQGPLHVRIASRLMALAVRPDRIVHGIVRRFCASTSIDAGRKGAAPRRRTAL